MELTDRMQQSQKMEIAKRLSEAVTLQEQINPHFLYNALDCIRGQALREGCTDIAEMTLSLSKYFRYSVSHKGDVVTLEDELRNVQDYFCIQQFRFGNRHSLQIHNETGGDDVLDIHLPKMTLQPIVENAIMHGIESKIDGGQITIRITMTQRDVIIKCSDTGVGMAPLKLEQLNHQLRHAALYIPDINTDRQRNGGIAMQNVNRRLRLYFGEEYGIEVYSIEGMGTDVEVRIPLMMVDEAHERKA